MGLVRLWSRPGRVHDNICVVFREDVNCQRSNEIFMCSFVGRFVKRSSLLDYASFHCFVRSCFFCYTVIVPTKLSQPDLDAVHAAGRRRRALGLARHLRKREPLAVTESRYREPLQSGAVGERERERERGR